MQTKSKPKTGASCTWRKNKRMYMYGILFGYPIRGVLNVGLLHQVSLSHYKSLINIDSINVSTGVSIFMVTDVGLYRQVCYTWTVINSMDTRKQKGRKGRSRGREGDWYSIRQRKGRILPVPIKYNGHWFFGLTMSK